MGRPRVPDIEIRVSQEYDGRWIGSIEKHGDMNVSGMDVYARTPSEAASEAVLLMMCVRRDRIRHGEEAAVPTPSSKERAREIVARVMNTAKDSVMGTAFRGAITAAIDAAVEEEREACAGAINDVFNANINRDAEGFELLIMQHDEYMRTIRARGASRE